MVTYERLSDPRARVQELSKVVAFLGTGWTPADVQCAFDSPQGSNSLRPREEVAAAATLVDVYPVTLACEMWRKHLKCVHARCCRAAGRLHVLELLTAKTRRRDSPSLPLLQSRHARSQRAGTLPFKARASAWT